MRGMTVDDCRVVELETHDDGQRLGHLTVVGRNSSFPFSLKRVYYLYDVPGGESRGGHAHKKLYQLLVAVSGSFTVVLDDGKKKRSVFLNRSHKGLLIVPGIWRTLEDFSSGAVCLVLASEEYDENDYIRNYQEFVEQSLD